MAGCCSGFSKFLNYVFNTIMFALGAAVTGVAIWYLCSDFAQLLQTWWVWISVFAGIILIIVSFIGCWATKKQNKCFLSVFWIISGLLLALFTIAAVSSSVFFSLSDSLSSMSPGQLNFVGGSEYEAYKYVRSGYGELWRHDNCAVECQTSNNTLTCNEATCDTSSITSQMNDWIRNGLNVATVPAYNTCVTLSRFADGIDGSQSAASGWCSSNTQVIWSVRGWALGAMIGLWVVAGFCLLLVVSNCVLICSKKQKQTVGVVVEPGVYGKTSAVQMGTGNVTVVHV